MKKIFAILVLSILALGAMAQYTNPRYGEPSAGRDNTGRVMTWHYFTIVDVVGNDSTNLIPFAGFNLYYVALIDSVSFATPNIAQCHRGDELKIIAKGASGKFIKFTNNTLFVTTATKYTLSTNGTLIMQFTFDGSVWNEDYALAQ